MVREASELTVDRESDDGRLSEEREFADCVELEIDATGPRADFT